MRYVVTGAAGFIGSRLCEVLLDLGGEVVGVDSFTDYYPRPEKERNVSKLRARPGFRLVEADLLEADLPALLAGAGAVFHLAAQPGVRASWGPAFRLYADRNIVATQRLLEAAAGRVGRLVFASSSSVYGDAEAFPTPETAVPAPISPYGVTKLAAEHLVRRYHAARGLPAVVLRYFTVYGPRQRPDMAIRRLVESALSGRPFPLYGDGEQTRDVTYVDDAVAATISAAAAPAAAGGIFNVGGGTPVTLSSIIEEVGRAAGRAVEIEHAEAPPGDARKTAASIDRARAVLGFRPSVALEEGIRRTVEWRRSA